MLSETDSCVGYIHPIAAPSLVMIDLYGLLSQITSGSDR